MPPKRSWPLRDDQTWSGMRKFPKTALHSADRHKLIRCCVACRTFDSYVADVLFPGGKLGVQPVTAEGNLFFFVGDQGQHRNLPSTFDHSQSVFSRYSLQAKARRRMIQPYRYPAIDRQ